MYNSFMDEGTDPMVDDKPIRFDLGIVDEDVQNRVSNPPIGPEDNIATETAPPEEKFPVEEETPEEETPPVEEETPEEETPPVEEETPPVEEETPPVEDEPPVEEDTPTN